eukprot:2371152-Rhodomonas_salina.2
MPKLSSGHIVERSYHQTQQDGTGRMLIPDITSSAHTPHPTSVPDLAHGVHDTLLQASPGHRIRRAEVPGALHLPEERKVLGCRRNALVRDDASGRTRQVRAWNRMPRACVDGRPRPPALGMAWIAGITGQRGGIKLP